LAGELLSALERADALVARRRHAVAEAVRELVAYGLYVRTLAPGDTAAWHRLPVWAPDPSWRDRLVLECQRAGIPAQHPHATPVSELPMFALARQEGDTSLAERDCLLLMSAEATNTGERVAAALGAL
jgi:dTDP-4-amino-4,6-dideoxygalactose transaminase